MPLVAILHYGPKAVTSEFEATLPQLIEANRTRALWSMPTDYFPENEEAIRRVLQRIATRGDRETYVRATELLREWS